MMQTILLKTLMAAQDRKGATAIEYGLIAAGIGIAIIAGVTLLADNLDGLFIAIGDGLATS